MSRDVGGTIDRDDVICTDTCADLPSRGAGRDVMVVAAIASVDANRLAHRSPRANARSAASLGSVIRFCSSIALFRSFSSRAIALFISSGDACPMTFR